MKVDLFDFDLPENLVATEPASPREAARLLVRAVDGRLTDRRIADLPSVLRQGDLLVFNDTKVIPAQLEGVRVREGAVEGGRTPIGATLHRRVANDRWHAFVRGARKLRAGDALLFGPDEAPLRARAIERLADGGWSLAFELADRDMIGELERVGAMPLPPYITARRAVSESDAENYQTVFAAREGAVAAPTAGLHFTPDLLERLAAVGIGRAPVTLHVGAGTFLPVKADDTDAHVMHSEWGEIGEDTAERIAETRAAGGRVVAVGTTSLRIMEAAARAIGEVGAWSGTTDIFITPGHHFASADVLLTNFHLPRSTLVMLVAAFIGLNQVHRLYAHAIEERYRFYSYGDACLLSLDPKARAGG